MEKLHVNILKEQKKLCTDFKWGTIPKLDMEEKEGPFWLEVQNILEKKFIKITTSATIKGKKISSLSKKKLSSH